MYKSVFDMSESEKQQYLDNLYKRYGHVYVGVKFISSKFSGSPEPLNQCKKFDDYDEAECFLQYMRDAYEVIEAEVYMDL